MVADALLYFSKHFSDPVQIPSIAESLGISLDCLNMPLFLLTSRRAADDRLFRLEHPEANLLMLPI